MGLKERVENNAVVFFSGALVAGFLAGIGAYQGIITMAKLEIVSQADLARVEMLEKKDRFLSLYLRYALAHLPPFRFEVSDVDRDTIRDQLDTYMSDVIEEANKSQSLVAVGKGQGLQTTISFPDGSQWQVPPAFKAATLD
jgi:hypothetical protein